MDPHGVAIFRVLQRQAGIAHDAGQQVIEIMRQAARQYSQALEFLGLAELFLHPLLLADIAANLRYAYYPAPFIVDRRDGERDRNRMAALAQADGFEMSDPAAAANPFGNAGLFRHPVRR